MKLWMVIYLAGKIAGSVGPLPYDEDECHRRAVELLAEGKPDVVTPEGYSLKDVRFECLRADRRPDAEM